jgi:hypothetical protein
VPYHTRVSIDMKIFVGHWYSIRGRASQPPEIKLREDIVDRPVSFFFYWRCFSVMLEILVDQTKIIKQDHLNMLFTCYKSGKKTLCNLLFTCYKSGKKNSV